MSEQDRRQLIAGRVREARLMAGLSQGQVAKILELHRPSVSEIEAGKRRVTAEELGKMSELFDVSLTYLMGDGPEVLQADDPKVQLAARELQKLSPDALDGLLRALAKMRTDEPPKTGGA